MTDKMRIWEAVAKTDPKHTKAVSFGARKFTSIDAHWQVMRATETFGPIGEGWGYKVDYSTDRLSDALILTVADVTIWWQIDGSAIRQYGPIRGMSAVLDKGRVDDDAGKKAMTDALTKGLSHLGFSADVFLGLFDDNKYVQKMTREFAAGPAGAATRAIDESARDIAQQNGGETRSTYQIAKDKKAAKPKQSPKEWADDAIVFLNTAGTLETVNSWWKMNDNILTALQEKDEAQYERVATCADDARASLRAHQ